MSKTWATINKVLPFSCVDGPGNRFVIFFQGCNFRCLNCHNPYTIGLCNHCGECVKQCPHQALSIASDKVVWHTSNCQQCDTCITQCEHQSTPMTYCYHIDDVFAQVQKYRAFLNGITVSGGEATLQLPFIKTLFTKIKQTAETEQLSCFIDSNGYLSSHGWQNIADVMDGAMIDLKAWDNNVHQRLTGRDNQRVKESLVYLAKIDKLYEVRLLIIPKHTDLDAKVDELAEFLLALNRNIRIRINAFQTHGVKGEAKNWPPATKIQVEAFAEQLRLRGLTNLILPTVYFA